MFPKVYQYYRNIQHLNSEHIDMYVKEQTEPHTFLLHLSIKCQLLLHKIARTGSGRDRPSQWFHTKRQFSFRRGNFHGLAGTGTGHGRRGSVLRRRHPLTGKINTMKFQGKLPNYDKFESIKNQMPQGVFCFSIRICQSNFPYNL